MPAVNTIDKILARIDRTETCWLWTGTTDTAGYGRVDYQNKRYAVHRLVYVALVGPIPEGLVIDHLCRVPRCCRPDHLEPVTNQVNTRRGLASFDFTGKCRRGHDINTPGSVIVNGRNRCCARCKAGRDHSFYDKDNIWEEVKAMAATNNETVSDVIEAILREYVGLEATA